MVWNEVAPYYHKRWAKNEVGPFNVTNDLIKRAKIKSGQKVLDLACGTGLVTKKILNKVGKNGEVYGIDSSNSALKRLVRAITRLYLSMVYRTIGRSTYRKRQLNPQG